MAGVAVGASMAWLLPAYFETAMACLAAFFVCAAGNVFNDLCDVEIDRVNHPERVLPQGLLSIEYARKLAIGLNAAAVVFALFANLLVVAMVVGAIGILVAYNYRLKRVGVIGNAVVALSAALTFITGGLAADASLTFSLPGPMIPAIFAFLFHLIRELVKDVEDIEGDRRAGLRTLPLLIGIRKTLSIALGLLVVLALATFWPIFTGWFGKAYEVLVVYFIDLPLLALFIFVWGNPTPRLLGIGSFALKAGMALGLAALIVAR